MIFIWMKTCRAREPTSYSLKIARFRVDPNSVAEVWSWLPSTADNSTHHFASRCQMVRNTNVPRYGIQFCHSRYINDHRCQNAISCSTVLISSFGNQMVKRWLIPKRQCVTAPFGIWFLHPDTEWSWRPKCTLLLRRSCMQFGHLNTNTVVDTK